MVVAIGQLRSRRPERGHLTADAAADNDVGTLEEPAEPLAVVLVEWVQHRASLVRVVHGERDARARQRWQRVAPGTSTLRFHFENVGTQIGEQAGHRIGIPVRQVEDAHGLEQPVGHVHTVPAWSAGSGCQ